MRQAYLNKDKFVGAEQLNSLPKLVFPQTCHTRARIITKYGVTHDDITVRNDIGVHEHFVLRI